MVSWVFNYVYVMTNGQGGPGDATQVTELYIYQTAFQYQSPEIACGRGRDRSSVSRSF